MIGSGREFDLVPTRANGQPAFGAYLRAPSGVRHGTGLLVLTLAGDRISSVTRFDTSVLPWFGLPLDPFRGGDRVSVITFNQMVERRSALLDDTYGALSHAVRRELLDELRSARPTSPPSPPRSTSRSRPSPSTSASSRTRGSFPARRSAGLGS